MKTGATNRNQNKKQNFIFANQRSSINPCCRAACLSENNDAHRCFFLTRTLKEKFHFDYENGKN